MKLQTRILRLLGRLGGNNMFLIPDGRTAIENSYTAISWDHTKRIKFHIPFKGIKPQIFLGEYHPRGSKVIVLTHEQMDSFRELLKQQRIRQIDKVKLLPVNYCILFCYT